VNAGKVHGWRSAKGQRLRPGPNGLKTSRKQVQYCAGEAFIPTSLTPGGPNPVSFLRLIPNILQDQKKIWMFPAKLARGQYWKPAVIFAVITGALFMLDPYDPSYFRHTRQFHLLNIIVSGHNATVAMWLVMLGAMAIGLLRSDSYMKNTVWYACQALIDSELLTQVLKGIDRRLRPQDVMTYRHYLDSWFQDKGPWYAGPGSFPSGHEIAAISIATAFAIRYRHHSWAPWTAYGMAGIIGISRITLLSHFPSDVFAGAFLGYVIARYVVLAESPLAVVAEEEASQQEEVVRVSAAGWR